MPIKLKLKDNISLSEVTDSFITYITKAKTPASLLKRFEDVNACIKSIGKHSASKDFASDLTSIIARQKEVIILSFIKFWSQTGNVRALKYLLRNSQNLSYNLRSEIKHQLATWEIYIYCSVRFENSNYTYYYIGDDETLSVGDRVLVPTGEENVLTAAEIVKIRKYTYDSVPLPLSRTKKIHSRID